MRSAGARQQKSQLVGPRAHNRSMSRDDDTAEVVEATEAIDPPPTSVVYAWGDEPDQAWRHDAWSLPRRLADGRVVAAVIVAVAVAAVSVAATLVLTAPHGQRFSIRPPVEVLPPPPPTAAPPAPPPARPAPQVQSAPPVRQFPPGAERRFADALHGDDGMWLRNPAHANAQAEQLCSDLADGGTRVDQRFGQTSEQVQDSPRRFPPADAVPTGWRSSIRS